MNCLTASEYYKNVFGHKVYKLSLDAGCTCPTRDGTKGYGGCIFCSQSGSGEFTPDRNLSITEQIEAAKVLVQNKIKSEHAGAVNYIAYFQNFTNTYGDEDSLVKKYREALGNAQIAGIAIATRPDCVPQSILEKINALSKTEFPVSCGNSHCKKTKKYVSIEFGLQTSKPESARYICRRYENSEYADAILRIKKLNPDIHIVTHIIFGFPGESENDMLDSVRFALNAGTDGIKIQVLNILKGTKLAQDYEAQAFHILEMDEYVALVKKALEIIPPGIVVHRLTGDGAKSALIAPEWVGDKKRVLNRLRKD